VLALVLAALMLFAASPLGVVADNVNGHWSESWIRDAQDLGWILGGNLGASFNVDNAISRADMALIIWQGFGAPEASIDSPYDDVEPGSYYAEAFTFLYENGIMIGYGDQKAGPKDKVTREMIFVIIARLNKMGAGPESALDKYYDAGDISDWAVDAIAALTAAGIVEGDENGYVLPQDYITFAEFVKVLVASYDDNIDNVIYPLGPNPNEPIKDGNEVFKPFPTPAPTPTPTKSPPPPTPVPPSSPGKNPSKSGGGSLPAPGGWPTPKPTTPPLDKNKYEITAVNLLDMTLIVITTDAGITGLNVTAGTQVATVSASKPVANNKLEWRAVFDVEVPVANIIVTPQS